MHKYTVRKNFTAISFDEEKAVKGKLAFKTKETDWQLTESPVLVPISIHSHFHAGISGDLKMNAFISVLKREVRGRITILLTEKAHLHVESLKFQNNLQTALEACAEQAQLLSERFKKYFEACKVVFWKEYINQDPLYLFYRKKVESLSRNDSVFKTLLRSDAESTYTSCRAAEYPDKELFLKNSIEDLLEQCTGLLMIAKKGYRYQFYPGSQYPSTVYALQTIIDGCSLALIDVFLTIEKKTIL